jgi:hypothetical protein
MRFIYLSGQKGGSLGQSGECMGCGSGERVGTILYMDTTTKTPNQSEPGDNQPDECYGRDAFGYCHCKKFDHPRTASKDTWSLIPSVK